MKTETPNETRYTHDFPSHYRKVITELERENAALKIERNRLRVVLQDIADASGFDNIGNWARNKAKNALAKEAQP